LINEVIAMKNLLPLAVLVFCSTVMADQSTDERHVEIEPYRYAMHLDIASVISITTPADKCNAAPVTMIYRDSSGHIKGLEYLSLSTDCDAFGG